MARRLLAVTLLGVVVLVAPVPAAAQPLGTFRWQFQPYCNVVAVTVVQQGAQYQLDGTDDQCGAGQRASVTGLAFLNPDGSIGFGLTIVTAPGGASVQVDATIAIATLNGTWRDSTGATGAFVFTPGASVPGTARPVPARGDVTAVTAGTGLTGGGAAGDLTIAVDFAAAQQRVTGTCPAAQLMTGVNQDGSVTCASVTGGGGGDITGVTAGTGLVGGGVTGDVTVAVSFAGPGSSANAAHSDHTHQLGAGDNVGVGPGTLGASGGTANTALGVLAMQDHASGNENTAVGYAALGDSTTGVRNVALGAFALRSVLTGGDNVAIGSHALQSSTVSGLTAVGANAMRANTTGAGSTAVGASALVNNTTGAANTAVGNSALSGSTTASRNTAVGNGALVLNQTGHDNVAVGYLALFTNTAGGNTAVGTESLLNSTSGTGNTSIGSSAMRSNTTGYANVAVGGLALYNNLDGWGHTALGQAALHNSTGGQDNVAVGRGSMYGNTTGSHNVALGAQALSSNGTGGWNVAIGRSALGAASSSYNTAVGTAALEVATSGTSNTAIGFSALRTVTTGTRNIAIGAQAGYGLTTGSGNIYLAADVMPAAESNTIRIGNTQTAAYIIGINGATSPGGVGVFVNASGQLGTQTSSARFKDQVTPLGDAVRDKLQSLTPVSFVYKPEFDDGSRRIQYGLIAEEVAERFPELLVRDAEGRPQTVRYHLLAPLLLAEAQRLERERLAADRERDALAERLDEQAGEIARLRALVEALVTARRER